TRSPYTTWRTRAGRPCSNLSGWTRRASSSIAGRVGSLRKGRRSSSDMLQEFAVDPEVMTTWQNVRYLSDRFGVEHGRLISCFPRKWQRLVYEACGRHPELGDVEKAKIEVEIRRLGSKLISTGRPYDGRMAWLENAETEHGRRPFRAIIAVANP